LRVLFEEIKEAGLAWKEAAKHAGPYHTRPGCHVVGNAPSFK
jgi:hypothetical protein